MYKNVIFDIDGTILDTEMAILKSLQKALEVEDKFLPLEELRFALGIPGEDALKLIHVSNPELVLNRWIQLESRYLHEISIFTGLREVILFLACCDVKLGIVTSKTRQEFADGFEPFGLTDYFDHYICADDTLKHKPNPDPLQKCLDLLAAKPEETIYIGDTNYDMQCAKLAGAKFGLAYWGAKTKEGFHEADHIFNKPTEIMSLLCP
ncbi:HAD family hydrolase [Bacillus sp. FJAT-49736]|uniref:HAD family hydrolase n=1 Tax=Bacillus sp. FJAT-49736 TaxID=2833582 RepID=UPI001BC9D9CF|nr:HAD family hydrolase [Bacillus sp. FJAT-49736]